MYPTNEGYLWSQLVAQQLRKTFIFVFSSSFIPCLIEPFQNLQKRISSKILRKINFVLLEFPTHLIFSYTSTSFETVRILRFQVNRYSNQSQTLLTKFGSVLSDWILIQETSLHIFYRMQMRNTICRISLLPHCFLTNDCCSADVFSYSKAFSAEILTTLCIGRPASSFFFIG